VVVLGLVAAAFFGYIQPYDRARSDYNAALIDLAAAQGQLVTQITQAQTLAATMAKTTVADASALQQLNSQIAEATTLTTKPESRPLSVSQMRSEAVRLAGQVSLVQQATQQLSGLSTSLAQSQIDQMTTQLSAALPPAQTVLDQSAGQVADESVRTNLQSAIDQATSLLASPPADLNDHLTQLGQALTLLTSTSQTVTAAVQATAEGSYTYVLTGAAIVQGTNLVGGTIASVKVEVQQISVIVSVCWSNQTVTDPANCLVGNSTTPQWWVWSGMRSGTSAKVLAQSNNPDNFFWGTVTFESAAAQARAVTFTGASGCTRSDGTTGHAGADGQCA